MLLRRETDADRAPIDIVHQRAFSVSGDDVPVEDRLVRALRADAGWVPALSIVAEGPEGEIVGHVVGSEGHISGRPAVGIAPLAVLPERQGEGIGAALMHAVIAAADALDYPLAVLLGDPDFYAQFGFVPADTLGIGAPEPGWGHHFQVRPLHAFAGESGDFEYAAPFGIL